MAKVCERCNNETDVLYTVKSTLTHKRRVCWECKHDIEQFIKYNYKIKDKDAAPIRYDIVSINGERFIREDLIKNISGE